MHLAPTYLLESDAVRRKNDTGDYHKRHEHVPSNAPPPGSEEQAVVSQQLPLAEQDILHISADKAVVGIKLGHTHSRAAQHVMTQARRGQHKLVAAVVPEQWSHRRLSEVESS